MSIIETFSNSIDLTVIDEYDKDRRVFLEGSSETDFLDIYLTTFSEYVISEIQKLSG